MSNNTNLSKLANVLDDASDGQYLKSTGSGGVAFDDVSAGVTVYATITAMTDVTNPAAGDLAYVTANTGLYQNNGNGWYKIATINTSPTITSVQDASSNTTPFDLSTSGTATVITVTASDADEGATLTYSHSVTSGSLNGTTVTQGTGASANVFTVTPHASQPATFSLTFSVTDNTNTAQSVSAFSLVFGMTQQAKLTASDAAASDRFGEDVGASGDTVVVGATGAEAAYVFTRSGTTWSQQAILTASDAATGDKFGYGADVDGDTAVVTAPQAHLGNTSDAGAAYVFVRSGTTWTQQQKIQASDAAASDWFGNERAVAISGDYIVVGVQEDDNSGGNRAGAAYVYARSGTTWSQQAKLTASDAQATDLFGSAVGISGSTIVVGAIGEDTTAAQAGAAYVFTRSGTTWTQQQKIQASDAEGSDNFGVSVDIDGDTLVVGAWNEDTGASNAGAAYIFTRSGSTWSQQAKLTANDAEADDMFGNAVSVDGDTVAVAAYHEDTTASGAGSVYVFTRSGTTWTQSDKLQAGDAAASDYFGMSLALDGGTVIAGAPLEDAQGDSAGAAYIFT